MNRITEAEDDKLYQHAMFGAALKDKYLGNPQVVGSLLADYCMTVRDMLVYRATGKLSAPEFVARVNEMAAELSTIFSGQDKRYTPIIGWNSITLGARLKVALGSYWAENHTAHGDDPIKVLFAWLCWGIADAMQRSGGDEDMEQVIFSERTQSVIQLLLGTDERR